MVDHEQIRQLREISGEELLFCDRCGNPIEPAAAWLIEQDPSAEAQISEETWLCPDCRQALEKGEVEVEIEPEPGEPQ